MSDYPVSVDQRHQLDRREAGGWHPGDIAVRAWHLAGEAAGGAILDVLREAQARVVARHPVLAASFARDSSGQWRASAHPGAASAIRTAPGLRAGQAPSDVASAIVEHHRPFPLGAPRLKRVQPRFRTHVALQEGAGPPEAVVVLTADRLVVDELSMTLLAGELARAYEETLEPRRARRAWPEQGWRRHVTAAATGRPRPAPPSTWAPLRGLLERHGGHAPAGIPLHIPVDATATSEPLAPVARGAGLSPELVDTVAAAAKVTPHAVALAALAEPVAAQAGGAANLYIEVDQRSSDDHLAIGPFTTAGVLRVAAQAGDTDVASHLRYIEAAHAEASSPAGVAWATQARYEAGAGARLASQATIAVTAPTPPAPLDLPGLTVTEVAGPGRWAPPAQVTVTLDPAAGDATFNYEALRFPSGRVAALIEGAQAALARFAEATA